MEYGARYAARTPLDPTYPQKVGKYLDAVLPVYGLHFADWWRDRLVPEMQRNFAYLEERLDHQADLSLMELATVWEDAIDIHDRHWKIHWMLNFAQLSATLNLRAAMEKVHGKIDEALLGRLQNSASDRNWDSIEALWKMKQEVKADSELAPAFGAAKVDEIIANLRATDRGQRFIAERVEPYQREYGWHAVWSHEFIFPSVREQMEPVIELVRGYLDQDYDFPTTIAAAKADIDAAADEIVAGLEGDARDAMRKALDNNLRMAPLTPDHHFYIDQGANAHMRLVLIAIGQRLVEMGMLDRSDDVIFLRYNELRVLMHADAAGLPVLDQLGLPGRVPPIAGSGRDRRPGRGHRRLTGHGRGDRPGGAGRGRVRQGPAGVGGDAEILSSLSLDGRQLIDATTGQAIPRR